MKSQRRDVPSSNHNFKVETYVSLGDLVHDDGVIDRRDRRPQARGQANDGPIGPPHPSSTSRPDTNFGLLINAGGHAFSGGCITGPPTQLSEPVLKSVQELLRNRAIHHPADPGAQSTPIPTPTDAPVGGHVSPYEQHTHPISGTGSGRTELDLTAQYSSRALQHDKTILNSLSDLPLSSVSRSGKTKALFHLTQTEIRYDIHDNIPYSILGFRLERGEDRTRCLEVKLTGTFTHNERYESVKVTDLRHVPVKQNQLKELQIQHTSTNQANLHAGFDGKPVALVNISGIKAEQYTHTAKQKIDAHFNGSQAEGSFDLILGLDKGAEKVLSVVESIFFFMVLRLEQERQPMQLKLNVVVWYVSKGWPWLNQNGHVTKSFTVDYSGQRSHDIIKN